MKYDSVRSRHLFNFRGKSAQCCEAAQGGCSTAPSPQLQGEESIGLQCREGNTPFRISALISGLESQQRCTCCLCSAHLDTTGRFCSEALLLVRYSPSTAMLRHNPIPQQLLYLLMPLEMRDASARGAAIPGRPPQSLCWEQSYFITFKLLLYYLQKRSATPVI